jgi:hypothetical protein
VQSFLRSLVHVHRQEGLGFFWRRFSPSLARFVPLQAFTLTSFNIFHNWTSKSPFTAAAMTGAWVALMTYPKLNFDHQKQIYASQVKYMFLKPDANGVMPPLSLSGPYRFFTGYLISSILSRSIYLGSYYTLRSDNSWILNAGLAYGAYVLSLIACWPINALRNRQTNRYYAAENGAKLPLLKILRTISSEEGFGYLFRGSGHSVRYVSAPIALVLFDYIYRRVVR